MNNMQSSNETILVTGGAGFIGGGHQIIVEGFVNAILENRFHLRGEDELIFIEHIQQWLHAIAVARDDPVDKASA